MTRNRIAALVVAGAIVFLTACETDNGASPDARERETSAIGRGFDRLTRSQQVPEFDYSQERQTLIDVMSARAEGAIGTAVATSIDGTILWWCPTQGAPIPSTYQLTSPDQVVGRGGGNHYEGQVLALGEPTGVYTGDSAATWTLCTDDAGNAFAQYEEGNVRWIAGVVADLPAEQRARVDEITYEFTTAEADG